MLHSSLLSCAICHYAGRRYAECRHAECRGRVATVSEFQPYGFISNALSDAHFSKNLLSRYTAAFKTRHQILQNDVSKYFLYLINE